MDVKDRKILEILKRDSSLTTREIAKKVKIPITTVHNRIKKLKDKGIIKKFTIDIDHKKLGKNITAYIFISLNLQLLKDCNISQDNLAKKISIFESVENVSIILGRDAAIVVKAVLKDVDELSDVLMNKIQQLVPVSETQTSIILKEF